jgi:hypothetical protein
VNKLKEILSQRGKALDEEELRSRIEHYGFNPDHLSDEEAEAVANEIAPQTQNGLALTNSKASTPAKSKGKGGRRKALPTVREAAAHTASVANQELTEFGETLDKNLTLWENDRADQLLARVRNAPKNVVSKFVETAMQEGAETESFRQTAIDFTGEFYPIGSDNAAT